MTTHPARHTVPLIFLFFALFSSLLTPRGNPGDDHPAGLLPDGHSPSDSTKKRALVSARSLNPNAVHVRLRSVDISRFPEVSVILDARDKEDHFYPDLTKSDLVIYHDGRRHPILSIENISARNSIPVDIVFLIDQTGSMRKYVEEVRLNVEEFTLKLASKGVDYRLGLITFSDRVLQRHEFTVSVKEFKHWVNGLRVAGGGDSNENALEGIHAALQLRFRPAAQKILILITDAMFHQKGDGGDGQTEWTTGSIAEYLVRKNAQLFAVIPPDIEEYQQIVQWTHGESFAIMQDFSSILTGFSQTLTNLYAVKYRLEETTPPEEASIEIRNSEDEILIRQNVELLAVDQKFVVDNILFEFDKATLGQNTIPQLNHILAMLLTYPKIEIEIQGHTDDVGSEEYNIALSEARARAVRKYLVDRGIAMERLNTRGLGMGYPIAPNTTDEGRQLNRRTEIVITRK